jgi:hypothetical protein
VSSLETLAEIGKIAGGVVAAMTFVRTVTGWWRTGPGRRRVWARDFAKLAPHVRPEYVEALFGAPAFELAASARTITIDGTEDSVLLFGLVEDRSLASTWSDEGVRERVWLLGADGYLTTWSGDEGLIAYSLTTSSRRFHPKIRVGATWGTNGGFCDVTLGRTRLAAVGNALSTEHPDEIVSWRGARRHEYYETYDFGNLSNYQTWACGVSGTGYRAGEAGAVGRLGPDDSAFLRGELIKELPGDQRARLTKFRAEAVVNSVMVQDGIPLRLLPDLPRTGPDHDLVRTLAKKPGWRDRWRHRRRLHDLKAGMQKARRRVAWLARRRRVTEAPVSEVLTRGPSA